MGLFDFISDAASTVGQAASSVANTVADATVAAATTVANATVTAANAVADTASSAAGAVAGVVSLSKGVEMYGYGADNYRVSVYGRSAGLKDQDATTHNLPSNGTWQRQHFEIHNASAGTRYEGKVGFRLFAPGDKEVYERSLRVNANTGGTTGEDVDNLQIPSRIEPGYCATFGLYNSDAAIVSDLPKQHQVYVSVTRPQHDWQQRLFTAFRQQKPTETLCLNHVLLPGSHDAGMYQHFSLPALTNMGNTQRDTIYTQMQLGARYFDFRPGSLGRNVLADLAAAGGVNGPIGRIISSILSIGGNELSKLLRDSAEQLRHIHLFLPGETYVSFLNQVVRFLRENPQEIAVVRIKYDGFLEKPPVVTKPSNDRLRQLAAEALQGQPASGPALQTGTHKDFGTPVAKLIESGKRLLFMYQNDDSQAESDKLKSWQTWSDAYSSYDAGVIQKALAKLSSSSASELDVDWVDAQLQLTATSEPGAITRALMATTESTSPLLATKPRTDYESYRFVRDSLNAKGRALITLCNDFYDNGLTDSVYHANLRRLGLQA